MAVRYVALKRLKVAGGVFREPGDEVPEASSWRNVHSYLEGGHLKVLDHDVAAKKPKPALATEAEEPKPKAAKPTKWKRPKPGKGKKKGD